MLAESTALGDLAERQAGQIAVRQARAAGVPGELITELVSSGIAEWVLSGVVLRIRGGARPDHPEILAHWLALDDRVATERDLPRSGVVSHNSAVQLYGLPGLAGAGHEFTAAYPLAGTVTGDVVHVAELAPDDWQQIDGIPVTTPQRTVQDLAAQPGVDAEDLDKITSRFIRHGLGTEAELSATLRSGARP